MNRLDIAIALLEEARDERDRLEKMNREIDKLRAKQLERAEYWTAQNMIDKSYQPIPHKAHINENIKVARRILLGEYMK